MVLVENKRVNGKVRQETIAVLGSIEATLLADFWEGSAPGLKAEDWELQSLRGRTAFWLKANRKLKQLANRLGPEAKPIRMAAHARVPWPMEAEREKLELLEARAELDFWGGMKEATTRIIASHKVVISNAQEKLAENEALAREEDRFAVMASAKLGKLSAHRPR